MMDGVKKKQFVMMRMSLLTFHYSHTTWVANGIKRRHHCRESQQ